MPTSFESIQDSLKRYNKAVDQPHIEAGERERAEILTRFPREAWPTLPLERYAPGQENYQDTYCYWLEFDTPHLGSMRGGSSTKHLIYKPVNHPGWYFSPQYANEQVAWEKLRAAFLEMFKLADAGEWDGIDEITVLRGGRSLRMKTLHVYFRDAVLPISSIDHIRQFPQRLGGYTVRDLRTPADNFYPRRRQGPASHLDHLPSVIQL